jgi:phosphoenolpyruvate carboxykinase (ATP)
MSELRPALRLSRTYDTVKNALGARSGHYTGRSPRDKFIVRESSSASQVWWGDVNQALEPEQFQALRNRLLAYLQDRDVFVQDCFVGADPHYRLPLRIITETAWHPDQYASVAGGVR